MHGRDSAKPCWSGLYLERYPGRCDSRCYRTAYGIRNLLEFAEQHLGITQFLTMAFNLRALKITVARSTGKGCHIQTFVFCRSDGCFYMEPVGRGADGARLCTVTMASNVLAPNIIQGLESVDECTGFSAPVGMWEGSTQNVWASFPGRFPRFFPGHQSTFDIKANRWNAHETSIGCDPNMARSRQCGPATEGWCVLFRNQRRNHTGVPYLYLCAIY